jgi:hypothetical protein
MIDIITHLNQRASSAGDFGWTASWPARCDWMILGFFTGYRKGEYGQTGNCSYSTCARGGRSGEFAGIQLAACHPDFLFFDFCSNVVPQTNKLNCIGFLEIRFRWKKSLRDG